MLYMDITMFLAFIFFYLPFVSSSKIIPVPSGGPESFAFLSIGDGPYTGVNDGRILKYQGHNTSYVDFAYASPNRNKTLCDGKNDSTLGPVCGRALGLEFNQVTKELYIADAYYGLCVVGPSGGLARQLLNGVEGIPFKWLDGLDVDQTTGNVYITEMSTKYYLSQQHEYLTSNDRSGRLIEYNPHLHSAKVLLSGLQGASGVGVSLNSTFVLVSEYIGSRITKYWLKGPKANTSQVLLRNITEPGNIKRDEYGWFCVACNIKLDDANLFHKGIMIDDFGTKVGDSIWGSPYTEVLFSEFHETRDGFFYLGSLDESYFIVFP